jgi:hypothetical protein
LSKLRQLPGAQDLEDAWIRARLGEDGYLTGNDAQAGTMDPAVIDQLIDLARTAAAAEAEARGGAGQAAQTPRSPCLPGRPRC